MVQFDNYYHVLAFVGDGLRGNPAGVYYAPGALSREQMQLLAADLCLPEVSFVWQQGEDYHIRWFAPSYEVPLCGHGTLAAAYVLFNRINPALQEVRFHYSEGELLVQRDAHDSGRLVLNFPAKPAQQIASTPELEILLGVKLREVWQSHTRMVVLDNEQQVRVLQPQLPALTEYVKGSVLVTAAGDNVDFVSRYFTQSGGEDAVTGSAHCTSVPYWAAKLKKNTLHAQQLSPAGGELFCQLAADNVLIAGYARILLQGNLDLQQL